MACPWLWQTGCVGSCGVPGPLPPLLGSGAEEEGATLPKSQAQASVGAVCPLAASVSE